MKALKVYEVRKIYKVLCDKEYNSLCFGKINSSYGITEVYDPSTDTSYFSEGDGDTHINDLIPGGSRYLATTLQEAIEELERKR